MRRISRSTRADRSSFSRCSAISRWCAVSSSRAAAVGTERRVRAAAGGAPPRCAQKRQRAGRESVRPADGAQRRQTYDRSRGAPAGRRRPAPPPQRGHAIERRIHALEPQQPVTRSSAPARRPARRRRAPRRPRRPGGTAARRRARPAPTRRSARRSSRVPERRTRWQRATSGDRAARRSSSRTSSRLLALEVRHPAARQRLERPRNRDREPPRPLRHAALLAAIPGQEHDDAVRLARACRCAGSARRRCRPASDPVRQPVPDAESPHSIADGCRNLRNSVPRPRNDRKPNTSVNVVMKTDEASAGSTFSARSASGISVPAVAATNMLMTIARPRIEPEHRVALRTSHTTSAATDAAAPGRCRCRRAPP